MKVATIGTGGIAQRHLECLSTEPDVEIVGHVTPSSGGAADATRRWGGRAYRDYRRMLEEEQVDAVWICVPPSAHGAIEHDLIEHSIPFFVEKPLDAGGHTAGGIAAALKDTGLIVAVGYDWRAMDTIPEVQMTLAKNPARMLLGEWLDSTPPVAWWRHEAQSGGQMVEQATHLVDLARLLVGEATVLAAAAAYHDLPAYPDADVADVSAALLRFHGNAIGSFTATCALDGPGAIRLRVICDGLLITITEERVIYDSGNQRREVRIGNDPIFTEDRAFLEAVRQNDPSLLVSSYADALKSHRLACSIRDAAAASAC